MSSERLAEIPLPIASVSVAVHARRLSALSSSSVYSAGSAAAPLCAAASGYRCKTLLSSRILTALLTLQPIELGRALP